ncbi:MAG: YHYH protein [Cyclobacteriaceae bacterium]
MRYFILILAVLALSNQVMGQCDPSAIYAVEDANAVCIEIDDTNDNVRMIYANNYPDHSDNYNQPQFTVTADDYEYSVCAYPVEAASITPLYEETETSVGCTYTYTFGVSINGVKYDPSSAVTFVNDDDGDGDNDDSNNLDWHVEATYTGNNIGQNMGTDNGGHLNPFGEYHYHAVPTSYFTNDLAIDGTAHSPIVGYAADGFPVYYKYVYSDSEDAESSIVAASSGYSLRSGSRGGDGKTAPDGDYDGSYYEDYEYDETTTILDACNGRYGVTPDFEYGTYYYVLTDEYPYIPRCFQGSELDNTFRVGPSASCGSSQAASSCAAAVYGCMDPFSTNYNPSANADDGSCTYASSAITWTGEVDSDWGTAGNWDTNAVPTSSDDVVIPSTSETDFNAPTIASETNYEVNGLTIEADGRVEIGPMSDGLGSTLTVNGDLENAGLLRANENSSLVLLGSYTAEGSGVYANSRTVYGDLSYSIFSLPFTDGSFDAFNGVIAYEWDNENGNFIRRDYGDATVPGKGYFIASEMGGTLGEQFSLGFGGSPVGADVNIPVKPGTVDNFNLVGNPYTAAISVSAFLSNANNTANTTGAIYFWDDGGANAGANRAGDYVTVNSMGNVQGINDLGDGVAGLKGTAIYDGYITTMQGFYVEATAVGPVTFTQDMQVVGNNENDHFYRTSDEAFKVKISLSGEGLYNETLIGFVAQATVGIDYSLDAVKREASNPISIYSIQNESKFAIQALPFPEEVLEVQLGFDLAEANQIQLNVEELKNLPTGYELWLDDAMSGQSVNLTEQSLYEFSSEVVTSDDRLSLRVVPANVTGLENALAGTLTLISGDADGISLSYLPGKHLVSLYDLSGKVLFRDHVVFQEGVERVNVSIRDRQVYVLRVGEETMKFGVK